MSERVFQLQTTVEDDRPFDINVATDVDLSVQLKNIRVIRGEEHPDNWTFLEYECEQRGATDWDYFIEASTSGLFSQRAIDVFSPYIAESFVPLPAQLDGEPYYFLHCLQRIDCLDVARSKIKYFDHSGEIMRIIDYAFFSNRIADPNIFAIPEEPVCIFVTESIPPIVRVADLRGIQFEPLDSPE